MSKHLFGRAIDFKFYPLADDESVSAAELVTARIYKDEPSSSQIEAVSSGQGEIQQVTTWTATGEKEYTISFSALTDSDPHSDDEYEKYYIVVRFKYASGGPTVFDLETVHVFRPNSATSKISVTAQDVYNLEPRVEELADSILWTEAKIEAAIEDILSRLEAKGLKLNRIFNWQKLNMAAKRLACAYCCEALSGEGSQFWASKALKWDDRANTMFNSAVINYDIDGDDEPDPEEQNLKGAVMVYR